MEAGEVAVGRRRQRDEALHEGPDRVGVEIVAYGGSHRGLTPLRHPALVGRIARLQLDVAVPAPFAVTPSRLVTERRPSRLARVGALVGELDAGGELECLELVGGGPHRSDHFRATRLCIPALGDRLKAKGDAEGAKALWQRLKDTVPAYAPRLDGKL